MRLVYTQHGQDCGLQFVSMDLGVMTILEEGVRAVYHRHFKCFFSIMFDHDSTDTHIAGVVGLSGV